MGKELQILRESIFAALLESADHRPSDLAEAHQKVDHWVRLGRLDPGQWAPEALVVAHTEDGLPSPYEHAFWQRVTEIANSRGCRVYSYDVTHFTVGFFQDVRVPEDVAGWIERAANVAQENTRLRLQHALKFNNISSPIEQLFYVCWESLRAELRSDLDPNDHELGRHLLYPQFPIASPAGEEYLIDFAVMRFDAQMYRRLVRGWGDRQDPYSDGNWIGDPYPEERSKKCNVNIKVAIECDSYTHHVEKLSPSEFEYQKRRERFLQTDGWTVFPFSGREINRDPMKCVSEVQMYLRHQISEERNRVAKA